MRDVFCLLFHTGQHMRDPIGNKVVAVLLSYAQSRCTPIDLLVHSFRGPDSFFEQADATYYHHHHRFRINNKDKPQQSLVFQRTSAFHKCLKDLSGLELDKWVYIDFPVKINTNTC
jgi:hypothetical protein